MPHYDDAFEKYVGAMRRRLRDGYDEYGDRSFSRPPSALIGEIQEELEDVANWAFIAWLRMERLKEQMSGATRPPPAVKMQL